MLPSPSMPPFEGSASMAPFHVPSYDCRMAISTAGRWKYGVFAYDAGSWSPILATSVTARYWIGSAAFPRIQPSGKTTGAGGGGGGGKSGTVGTTGEVNSRNSILTCWHYWI